jgi:AcrR family transcriptional regulator
MVKNKSTLIWQRLIAERAPRKLDYVSLIGAATNIADRQGLAAVTMRSVAAAVGAGTMSLYRYVSGKDDLLDLILDAAYGEIPLPVSSARDWQDRLTRVAMDSRRVLKAHSWLAPLLTSRPTLGPNYLRWFEYLLAATASPHRDMKTQVRMIGTMWSFVTGFVAYELGEIETHRKHKLTEARKRQIALPYVTQVIATGKFPYLEQFLKSGAGRPTDDDFREGLRAVLAGIASI